MTMTPYNTDLTRALKWQQNNAPNLQSIIEQKATWYEKYQTGFWTNWQTNVFDIRTSNAFGLVIWCIILGIPLDLFNFELLTNDWAYGSLRGNYLDGGGNTLPMVFVAGPTIYANGVLVPSAGYTVNATAGTITFGTAPANNAVLSWKGTVTQNDTGQDLIVKQPRVFGTGNGTQTAFSLLPSDAANFNETGNNFYGGGNESVSLLSEVRFACQLRYIALVSNGRQQWINQMLAYIFNEGAAWDFPNKKYFYLTDNTLATQAASVSAVYRQDWQGNQLMFPTPRTNFLNYSQAFENAAWTNTNYTVTAAATTAPDGTNTGEKLADSSTATVNHSITQNATTANAANVNTITVYAKAADRPNLDLRLVSISNSANYVFGTFNLSTAATNATNAGTATGATASIVSMGNGWYRCTLSGVADPTGTGGLTAYIFSSPTGSISYAGVAGQGIYIWGAQLETSASATAYIATTSAAGTVTDYTVTNANTGAITMSPAPLNGAVLSWSGTWNWATAMNQQFGTGNGTMTAFTLSNPPGGAKAVTRSNYMEYRIGANMGISSAFLNILNNPQYGLMPTCAGIAYSVVQET